MHKPTIIFHEKSYSILLVLKKIVFLKQIKESGYGGSGPKGVYRHIWAIEVCAAVKGMVFKQFTLGEPWV